MASNSSSVFGSASVTYTFSRFKSITSNAYSGIFYLVNEKELPFDLGIHPRLQFCSQDVFIGLCHAKIEEPLNLEYEVSILNAKKEKSFTKYYQCKYDPKYGNNVPITNFMLYNELIKEANGFVLNDALTLFCEVKILKVNAQILEPNLVLSKLCEDFESILATGEHSDFVLAVGDKEFKVHKNILSARSSVFKAMLSVDLEEKKTNRVEIIDVNVEVFEQLLNYIYSGTVAKLDECALELFIAADKYQLEQLKSICGQSLSSNLTVDTVANILLFADMHSAPELKASCIKFVNANSVKVMQTDGWKEMKKNRIELMADLYENIVKAHSTCKF